MTIRVIYDASAFADSLNSFGHSSLVRICTRTRVRACVSFEFFEELAPLRHSNHRHYNMILSEYSMATLGHLVLHVDELLKPEVSAGRPLTRDEIILPREDYQAAIDALAEEDTVKGVADDVSTRKRWYARWMNERQSRMRQDAVLLDQTQRNVACGFNSWFEEREALVQAWCERDFECSDVEYRCLPHVRASYFCLFEKLRQAASDRRPHDRGDLHDRAYIVASVLLGHLVSDDKDLRRTAKRINADLKIYSLQEFVSRVVR